MQWLKRFKELFITNGIMMMNDFFIWPKKQTKITDQFFVTLRASFESVKDNDKNSSLEITDKIEKLFEVPRGTWKDSWKNAYEIERYLVQLYDEATLEVELNRRLVDVKEYLNTAVYDNFKHAIEDAKDDINSKRSILHRMVDDLQWYYTNREEKHEYARITRSRTIAVFITSLIIFLLGLGAYYYISNKYPESVIRSLLPIAATTGLFGASFSMLVGLDSLLEKRSSEDLKIIHRIGYILLRPIVGIGAALILFFLLKSGLFNGEIFPDITADSDNRYKQISLLIVWSFIAGFSEKFVPNLITKTESSAP